MLQHINKASQIGFGGNLQKVVIDTVRRPEFWATIAIVGKAALGTVTAVVTAPATLPIAGGIAAVAGTAYILNKLNEEDDSELIEELKEEDDD